MRKILCSFLKLFLGVCCCASVSYASSPAPDRSRPAAIQLSASSGYEFLNDLPARVPEALQEQDMAVGHEIDVMKVIYRISYVGAVVLTADRVVRSVDSVLDRMHYDCEDGTSLRFVMEPKHRGFDVMLKMTRPLEF